MPPPDTGLVEFDDKATVDYRDLQMRCTCPIARANEHRTGAPWCKHIDKSFANNLDVISEDQVRVDPWNGKFWIPACTTDFLSQSGYHSGFEFDIHPQFHLMIGGPDHNMVEVAFHDTTEWKGVGRILAPPTSRKHLRRRFIEHFLGDALDATCPTCVEGRPELFQAWVLNPEMEFSGNMITTLLLFMLDVDQNGSCMECRKRGAADMIPALASIEHMVDRVTGDSIFRYDGRTIRVDRYQLASSDPEAIRRLVLRHFFPHFPPGMPDFKNVGTS